MSSLLAALRNRWVWLGVLGTTLVAWGSTHPEFSLTGDWPNATVMAFAALVPIPVNRVLLGAGAIGLAWAWWRLRPTPSGRHRRPGSCWRCGACRCCWRLRC